MTAGTDSRSTIRSIALATVVAAVLASVVNTVISLVAQAAGADPAVFQGLKPMIYILFTVVGVLVGAVVWNAVRTRAAAPAALLRWLVPVTVAVSLIPDVLLGVFVGWDGAVALALMHLAVAAVAVAVFRRVLPLAR